MPYSSFGKPKSKLSASVGCTLDDVDFVQFLKWPCYQKFLDLPMVLWNANCVNIILIKVPTDQQQKLSNISIELVTWSQMLQDTTSLS